jgi:hypothetical protein
VGVRVCCIDRTKQEGGDRGSRKQSRRKIRTMISLIAVGETPSPSLDCLNFLMAMGGPRRPGAGCGGLSRARKTRP